MQVALTLIATLGTDAHSVGLILAVVAAACLYLGSKETPAAIRGNPREENTFRRRRRGFTKLGCALLAVAFSLQLLAVALSRL